MSYQLVAEVLDHAPEMSPTERLVLVAIAEVCRVNSRQADIDTETLQRRTGVDATNVRGALRRLAGRGLDVRVALGKDKRGAPVYAHKGRVARYQLPELPAPVDCDCDACIAKEGERRRPPLGVTEGGRQRPPIAVKGGRQITKGGRETTKGGRWNTQRRTQASTHPSVVPPSGELPDHQRAPAPAREPTGGRRTATRASPAAAAPPLPRVVRPPDWRAQLDALPPVDPLVAAAGADLCRRVLVEGVAVVDQVRPPPPDPPPLLVAVAGDSRVLSMPDLDDRADVIPIGRPRKAQT